MAEKSVQLPTEDEIKAIIVRKLNASEINREQAEAAVAQYRADVKRFGPPLSDDQFKVIDEKVEKTSFGSLLRGTVSSLVGNIPGGEVNSQEMFDELKDDHREGLIQAEKFKMVNPEVASMLEGIGPVEAALIGAGGGLAKIGRGLTGTKPEEFEQEAFKNLKKFGPAGGFATAGEIAGETAPFLTPATLASGIASVPVRAVVGTALGGLEGGVIARGEGGDVGKGAGIGASIAGALEVGVPVIGRAGGALFRKLTGRAPKAPIIDTAGNYTDEFVDMLSNNNIKSDDFLADVQSVVAGTGGDDKITNAVADVATAIKSGEARDLKAIAASPDIDPQVLAAAERLGVAEDLPVSALSKNQQFIELEQGLSSIIGSDVSSRQVRAIESVKTKADDIITELGGTTTDTGGLSERVFGEIDSTLTGLQAQSNDLYDQIAKAVLPETPVSDMAPLQDYMREQLKTVANQADKLDKVDKQLIENLMGTEGKGVIVTYAMIDRERKKVGEQLAKKSTPFPDATEAELSKAYAMLTDLQGSALQSMDADKLPGGGAKALQSIWQEGKDLVAKRKGIEEGLVDNFGKNFGTNIIPTLEAGLFKLPKDGTEKFAKAIDAVPENMRAEAIATSLNNVFTAGSRQSKLNMGGFADWYNKLNRNQTAKNALLKHLPEGGAQRIEDLATVSNSFRNALLNKKDTGRVATLFSNYDKPNGLLDKLYNLGGNAPDPTTRATSMVVRASMKGGDDLAVTADRMLGSEQFKRMVVASVDDPTSEAAQRSLRALTASKPYNQWVEALPKNVRAEMLSAGIIPWLVSEDEEQRETGVQP